MAQDLSEQIRAAAAARGLDPELAVRIAQAESSLDPGAKNPKSSARGLFQVTKDTWEHYGGAKGKRHDVNENIRVAMNMMAANRDALKSHLGRDPTGAEIYAAHFFGTTGAKRVLSADPDTPLDQVVSKQVLKANPQLQGKTAGEAVAQLGGKVGEMRTAVPSVSRETMPVSAPADLGSTEAERMMEPALRSGMTASVVPGLADMGPGYQAALALSVLAGVDEEESPKRDVDSEPGIAEKWLASQASRPAALAEFQDISVRSPFASAPVEGPVRMADGGDVTEENLRNVRALGDPEKWVLPESILPGGSPLAPVSGAQKSILPEEVFSPRPSGLGLRELDPRIEAFMNAETPAQNRARMEAFQRVVGTVADLLPVVGTIRAAQRYATGQPLVPDLPDLEVAKTALGISDTYRRAGADAYPIPNEGGDIGRGLVASPVSMPGSAIGTPLAPAEPGGTGLGSIGGGYNPEGFGGETGGGGAAGADSALSGISGYNPGGFNNSGYAEGGEVETPGLLSVPDYARFVSRDMYPGQQGQFDQQDAARHMLAAGTLARKYGSTAAEMLGNLHEITTSPFRYVGSKLGISEMPVDYEQDLHNNLVGIELGKRAKTQKELEDLVQEAAERAQGSQKTGQPWIGKPQRPVKRGDGGPAEPTPEEIAAASRPATVNPNILRQGEAARRLAAMRDVNALPDPRTYAAVTGFLGTAPDEMGFSALHPDIEGIKRAGEAGFNVGTVAQVAPVVGPAAKALSKLAATEVNKRMLAGKSLDPLFNTPPPIMFAIRERGSPFVMEFATWPEAQFPGIGRVDQPQNYVMTELAKTPDSGLNNWFKNKVTAYIRRDMGTTEDQFVKAADQGKPLHFMESIPKEDTSSAMDLRRDMQAYRKMFGFSPEGEAKTPKGKLVEDWIDYSITPTHVEDILGGVGEGMLPPFMRGPNVDPNALVMNMTHPEGVFEFGNMRDTMFKLRNGPKQMSAYGQPPVAVPERYHFDDKTLIGLTPAQASERVAQYKNWEQETRQKMASKAIMKNEGISRIPAGENHVWVNPPDLARNPQIKNIVQDVGCDAGWCTMQENFALQYGSGDNRLAILMDKNARPKAQMTITEAIDVQSVADNFIAYLSENDLLGQFRAANPDVRLYRASEIVKTNEFGQWLAENPPKMSITEIKGVNNKRDIRDEPYLKLIQDKVKNLDSGFDLAEVENLDGINMLDLRSTVPDKAIRQKMIERNGGSSFMDRDEYKSMVKSFIQEDLDAAKRASGGMIERRIGPAQQYL